MDIWWLPRSITDTMACNYELLSVGSKVDILRMDMGFHNQDSSLGP